MKFKSLLYKLFFPFIGLGALIWFLIRVIPKPTRATYPCMRVACPMASAFVLYLLGLATSAFAFGRIKEYWKNSRYLAMSGFFIIALIAGFFTFQADRPPVYANTVTIDTANSPIGTGKGIFPGRVVWVRDSAAVNQNCTNSTNDYWLLDKNTNQTAVNNMVSNAIQMLTGKGSDADSWDAIFRYYNQTHNRGDIGYTAGEKIVIKLNFNNGATGTSYSRADLSIVDSSPQIAYAILHHLVNVAGVVQSDISIGDPGRNFDDLYWNKCHPDFPNVHYWGAGNGRTPITKSANPELMTSDGQLQNYIPACYVEATYMISIPVFKEHHRAGMSLSSKNHFGSLLPFSSTGDAFPFHYSLPCTQGDGNVDNGGYGKYRIFVDFIGSKYLGGKTILYMFDALWSSTNYGDPPWKWKMAPFNNSYPASIFVSQDPVAIESVGFDFLHAEFYNGNPSGNAFPQYSGVDDFLRQAADSVNWPNGIKYNPEGDGKYLPRSMGVNEHWDNATDQKYSRDLGPGTGIELVKVQIVTSVNSSLSKTQPAEFILEPNYPNPFNPSTTIIYNLPQSAHVDLSIYNIQGQCIQKLVNGYQTGGTYSVQWNGRYKGIAAASGVYFARLNTEGKKGAQSQVQRMVLLK